MLNAQDQRRFKVLGWLILRSRTFFD